MNKVVLIGRLTKDPELKYTPGTGVAVSTFTLAVDRKTQKEGKKEADFVSIVAWSKTAELVANYTSKGKLIAVSGRIQTRSYDAKDGTKRYVTEVVADEVQFIEWNNKQANGGANSGNSNSSAGTFNEGIFGDNMTPVDDGDIPF